MSEKTPDANDAWGQGYDAGAKSAEKIRAEELAVAQAALEKISAEMETQRSLCQQWQDRERTANKDKHDAIALWQKAKARAESAEKELAALRAKQP